MTVETGLDRLAAGDEEVVRLVRGRRIGLLAHPASVTRHYQHALTVLRAAGADVALGLGPEHGFSGEAQDMVGVEDGVQHEGDLVLRSLYGHTFESLSPKAEWLRGLDAVVIDLQDVGARYYTFVWTAALCMKVAASIGVQTIVLDRPNPLGGRVVEGKPQHSDFLSFVGLYPVAVRHGLTIGEIALRVARVEKLPEEALHVVPMRGWSRDMLFSETGLSWVLPSPNMPTLDTALVYPGGCLIEATELSEGRGTTRPFEIWGAPGLDGQALTNSLTLPGAKLRPLGFEPTFQKHARSFCGGVQVHITDAAVFRSFDAYVRLLAAAKRQLGARFAWREKPYEFVTDRAAIDLLTGDPSVRESMDSDSALNDALALHQRCAQQFDEERRQDFLYR